VRRLIKHPSEPSWIISAMQDNNEVTVWNLESGSKQQTLWASSAPPLSNSQVWWLFDLSYYQNSYNKNYLLLMLSYKLLLYIID